MLSQSFNKRIGFSYIVVSGCLLLSVNGHTADLNSQDLVAAPAGTQLALAYFTYATRNSFTPLHGSKIKDGTNLDSFISIARYANYIDFAGFTIAPQILLPYGRLYNASLAGNQLNSAQGFADPILAAPIWLINKPERSFAIVPYLYVPIGTYHSDEALNIGENRWKFDLQLGGTQQLGNGFSTQISADAIWYGSNDDIAGITNSKLTQDNTYQLQAWLTYRPPSNQTWTFSTGYNKYWGGHQQVDGIENGQATDVDQLQLEVSKFITPTFQILGQVQRDLHIDGGFKQDVSTTLRLTKVF
ncbi:transporter [Acinetobacter baumannii]|uniref:transporter n=1 Tax=Acinetobacter baumannii TaxID=470 RepID=UPI00321AE6F7